MRYYKALALAYDSATSEARDAGEQWYPNARAEVDRLARAHKVTQAQSAFALAALSCNKSWPDNRNITDAVMRDVRRGKAPRGHYGECLSRAVRILRDGELDALQGPKVRPFGLALAGDDAAAVVDRHMWRAARGKGSLTRKRSGQVATALVQLARDVGESVTTLQATIWIVARGGRSE